MAFEAISPPVELNDHAPQIYSPSMGLHLGWIPNEPGLRARGFDRPAPAEPVPDPAKVAALEAAKHARGLWARLLIVIGLFALVLFGFIAAVARVRWAWAVA